MLGDRPPRPEQEKPTRAGAIEDAARDWFAPALRYRSGRMSGRRPRPRAR
jgi:hypothetical protein